MSHFKETGTEEYSQFIHLSRYSRWLDEENRRETWEETVDRYINFFVKRFPQHKKDIENLKSYILDFKVMPSMRCLMTAGKALEKDEVAGFNCSFVAIDHPRAFDEIMYILMCGTGVGFSVERQFINKLPEIAEDFHETDTTIDVVDSRIGWAKSLRELISLLYSGQIPKWDLSKLRPAGAKLKTFGGRSSGPDPLDRLFYYMVNMFKRAAGRKLTSIECHDLVCKIADVVICGGVRRSACLSLSNLSDDRMREAKSGQWWIENPQRALSNNSACYTEKPDLDIFLKEWVSLYRSKCGERGIFNRVATQKQVPERRDAEQVIGCNPCCVSSDTILMTEEGPRKIKDLENKPFKAVVNGKLYEAPRGSWKSGVGDIFTLKTKEGYEINLTPEHLILTKDNGWVQAKDLKFEESIVLHNHNIVYKWGGNGTYQEGYLLGLLVGDGNFSKAKKGAIADIKVWEKDIGSFTIKEEAYKYAFKMKHRSDWQGWCKVNDHYRMAIEKGLPQKFGIDWKEKTITDLVEIASYDFQRAFLKGLFDSDGHIEGTQQKGYTIRLGSIDMNLLIRTQRMLGRLGIKSSIHNLNPEGYRLLPNGKGGHSKYYCKKSYRLLISSESILRFNEHIGFTHDKKKNKLRKIINEINFYSSKFYAKVESFKFLKKDEVWDAEVSKVHAFDANGIYAHNSEILLRSKQFCNLTEVVIRSSDSIDDLKNKVRVATILGTFQSTLTNFRFLRKVWKQNTEEERLLGVSLTGIFDHAQLGNPDNIELPNILNELRQVAIKTNKEWAKKLNIQESTAITCVKPSGSVSQLVNSSSGIHPRYSKYYIRNVRCDSKDPMTQFMKEAGFPWQVDKTNSNNIIFSFPIKSPDGGPFASEVAALYQLKLWKIYHDYWCEHKPSCTVYYRDDEFFAVGDWVWNNFDCISGISFLPYSDHIYEQAPYEPISEEKYEELVNKMPEIKWSQLQEYEKEDNTKNSHTLACTGNVCEIVDLVPAE